MSENTNPVKGLTADKAKEITEAGNTKPDGLPAPVDTTYTGGLKPLTEQEMLGLLADIAGQEPASRVQDIWYKTQRVIRTIAQVLVGFILAAPTVTQIIQSTGIDPTSNVGAWLAGIGAATTAIAAALSRIMSIPAVNQWLVNIGLGSVPRSSLDGQPKHAAQ